MIVKLKEVIMLPDTYNNKAKPRILQSDGRINQNGLDESALKLEVISNQDSYEYSGFTWEFTQIVKNELHFKLDFPDTYLVSKASVPDVVKLTFVKPWYFVSNTSKQILVDNNTVITNSIPKQFPS